MQPEELNQIRAIVREETAATTQATAANITTLRGELTNHMANIDGRFASLTKLIEDTSASLQREMHNRLDDINASIASLEVATARNTRLMAGGSKTIAGLAEWAEKQDALNLQRDQQLRELRARLEALEKKAS